MTARKNPRAPKAGGISLLQNGNPAMVRKSGLVLPRNLPFKSWETIGGQLTAALNSSTWWIADWLVYGEDSYADRYAEAARRTSLSYQTLRNYTWIARSFLLSRRRDTLSFGHHAEVAALEQPEQDYWLRRAEEFGWSRNELRKQVRTSLHERRVGKQPTSSCFTNGKTLVTPVGHDGVLEISDFRDKRTLHLSLDPALHAVFEEAAAREDCALEEWAKQVLEAAAKAVLPPSVGRGTGQGPVRLSVPPRSVPVQRSAPG